MKRPTELGDGRLTGWNCLAGCLKQMGTPLVHGLLPKGDSACSGCGQRPLFQQYSQCQLADLNQPKPHSMQAQAVPPEGSAEGLLVSGLSSFT